MEKENLRTDPSKFVHLHIHDEYSLLDGFAHVEDYAKLAAERGYKYLAITNHGIMGQVPRQYKVCQSHDLIPIYGCEVYVNDYMHLKEYNTKKGEDLPLPEEFDSLEHLREEFKRSYHLTLLAKDERGFKNLVKITSNGWINGYYRRPRVSLDFIKRHSEGIICGSACMSGIVSRNILDDRLEDARKNLKWIQDTFGEDFFIEIMMLDIEGHDKINIGLINLLDEFKINKRKHLCITNDCHYLLKEDAFYQNVMLLLQNRNTFADLEKGKDVFQFQVQEFWYKTTEELDETYIEITNKYPKFKDVFPPDLYRQSKLNTVRFASRCGFEMNTDPKFPNFEPNEGKETQIYVKQFKKDSNGYLEFLAKQAMKKKKFNKKKIYSERIKKELQVISTKNYSDYFLIVKDIVDFAKKNNVSVGPGRGSAAGSLLCYLLGITDVDPIKHNLFFERFLNEARADVPDIDIDFSPEGRESVKEYIIKKYDDIVVRKKLKQDLESGKYTGQDYDDLYNALYNNEPIPPRFQEKRTCSIGTYGSFQTRATVLDVCRTFNVPLITARSISKSLMSDVDELDEDQILENPDYKKLFNFLIDEQFAKDNNGEKVYPYDAIWKIRNRQKNVSKHAAGVIISNIDLSENLPLITRDGYVLSSWIEGKKGTELSAFGFVKWDILGLLNLTFMDETIKLIKERYDENSIVKHKVDEEIIIEMPIKNVNYKYIDENLNDPNVYRDLRVGKSALIFQFESYLMRKLLKDSDCDNFHCLAAITALGRPGPLQSGMTEEFCARKKGEVEYEIHPVLEDVLRHTYGVFVYQEQIMQAVNKLAGYSLAETDNFRKVLIKVKKDVVDENAQKLEKYRQKFLEGGQKYMKRKELEDLFEGFLKWAGYGFNASHAVSYTIISYRCAWLKTYFPLEYFCTVLRNTSKGDTIKKGKKTNKYEDYIHEARRIGIKIKRPNINKSKINFNIEGESSIRIGLANVKGVGNDLAQNIVDNQTFETFDDYLNKTKAGKRVTIPLIIVGCFDKLPKPIGRIEAIIRYLIFKKTDLNKEFERWAKKESTSIIARKICEAILDMGDLFGDGLISNLTPKVVKDIDPEEINFDLLELNEDEKEQCFTEEFGFGFNHPMNKKVVIDYRPKFLLPNLETTSIEEISETSLDKVYRGLGYISEVEERFTTNNNIRYYVIRVEEDYGSHKQIGIHLWENVYKNYNSLIKVGNMIYFSVEKNLRFNTYSPTGYPFFVRFIPTPDNKTDRHRKYLHGILDALREYRIKNLWVNPDVQLFKEVQNVIGIYNEEENEDRELDVLVDDDVIVTRKGLDENERGCVFGFVSSISDLEKRVVLTVGDPTGSIGFIAWKNSNKDSLQKRTGDRILEDIKEHDLVKIIFTRYEDYKDKEGRIHTSYVIDEYKVKKNPIKVPRYYKTEKKENEEKCK